MRAFNVAGCACEVSAVSVLISTFVSGAGAAPAAIDLRLLKYLHFHYLVACCCDNLTTNHLPEGVGSVLTKLNSKVVLILAADHQRHSTEGARFSLITRLDARA